jgi:hypothetical protein
MALRVWRARAFDKQKRDAGKLLESPWKDNGNLRMPSERIEPSVPSDCPSYGSNRIRLTLIAYFQDVAGRIEEAKAAEQNKQGSDSIVLKPKPVTANAISGCLAPINNP